MELKASLFSLPSWEAQLGAGAQSNSRAMLIFPVWGLTLQPWGTVADPGQRGNLQSDPHLVRRCLNGSHSFRPSWKGYKSVFALLTSSEGGFTLCLTCSRAVCVLAHPFQLKGTLLSAAIPDLSNISQGTMLPYPTGRRIRNQTCPRAPHEEDQSRKLNPLLLRSFPSDTSSRLKSGLTYPAHFHLSLD